MSFTVKDLIDRGWSEMNCGQAVSEGLRRQGRVEASKHVPIDQESAGRLVAAGGGAWEEVDGSPRDGDVILSEGEEGLHVSLRVQGGYVLTSSRRHGVHMLRTHQVQSVIGKYRWGGAK